MIGTLAVILMTVLRLAIPLLVLFGLGALVQCWAAQSDRAREEGR